MWYAYASQGLKQTGLFIVYALQFRLFHDGHHQQLFHNLFE